MPSSLCFFPALPSGAKPTLKSYSSTSSTTSASTTSTNMKSTPTLQTPANSIAMSSITTRIQILTSWLSISWTPSTPAITWVLLFGCREASEGIRTAEDVQNGIPMPSLEHSEWEEVEHHVRFPQNNPILSAPDCPCDYT